MECLAFDGASFTNDPAFSGSRSGYHNRAKDPLPMEPEYETLPSKEEVIIISASTQSIPCTVLDTQDFKTSYVHVSEV